MELAVELDKETADVVDDDVFEVDEVALCVEETEELLSVSEAAVSFSVLWQPEASGIAHSKASERTTEVSLDTVDLMVCPP